MINRPGFLDSHFNGDKTEYEKFLRYGVDNTIRWNDIQQAETVYSRYRQQAINAILSGLGYLPEENIFQPHLSFIQALIHNYQSVTIPPSMYKSELTAHLKNIRNDDVKKGGWVRHRELDELDFRNYETVLPQFKNVARTRISQFLGYTPELINSLNAEIAFRNFFTIAPVDFKEWTSWDFKAGTVIKYRESFLLNGERIADSLELISHL